MTDLLSQSFRLPDGRTLTYAEYGLPGGKPVFYFHGQSGSRLEPAMLDANDFKKAGIRLIACDRPGMGGSDFQPGRGFSHWPADIVILADSLGLGKFGVFGVSGGGGYVSACARLIQDRLSAAVIVSGAGCMDSPEARACLPLMNRSMWKLAARSGAADWPVTDSNDTQGASRCSQSSQANDAQYASCRGGHLRKARSPGSLHG